MCREMYRVSIMFCLSLWMKSLRITSQTPPLLQAAKWLQCSQDIRAQTETPEGPNIFRFSYSLCWTASPNSNWDESADLTLESFFSLTTVAIKFKGHFLVKCIQEQSCNNGWFKKKNTHTQFSLLDVGIDFQLLSSLANEKHTPVFFFCCFFLPSSCDCISWLPMLLSDGQPISISCPAPFSVSGKYSHKCNQERMHVPLFSQKHFITHIISFDWLHVKQSFIAYLFKIGLLILASRLKGEIEKRLKGLGKEVPQHNRIMYVGKQKCCAYWFKKM